MLELNEIHDRVLEIASGHLGRKVKDLIIAPDMDFEGQSSLSVTIVLKTGWGARVPGKTLGDISLEIIDYLVENKDDRFPYTHYATVKELEELAETDD